MSGSTTMHKVLVTVLAVLSWQIGAGVLFATPWQLKDSVEFGGNEYQIVQLPLQGVIAQRRARDGKRLFTITESTNNKGYRAKWVIQGKQLFLIEFEAFDEDGNVYIADVVDGTSLPLRAKWFTGKLQFPIGEYNYDTKCWPLIVELDFEKGKLTNISASKDAIEIHTWNGIPDNETKTGSAEDALPPK